MDVQISDGVQVSDAFQALSVAAHSNVRTVVVCQNFSVGGRLSVASQMGKRYSLPQPASRKRWDQEGRRAGNETGMRR